MKFMIDIKFTSQHQAEIVALIPSEQAHVKELREQGAIEALYISNDRSRIWLVMQGQSQAQVQQKLKAFPLYPYMQAECTPLI